MNSLFPDDPWLPEGFAYWPDFLTVAEEQELLRLVSGLPLKPFVFHGFEAKRKTLSYGFDYHADRRTISKGEPIPAGFGFLLAKVAGRLGLAADAFQELLVTEYPRGSVINWHRDAPPFELIAGVSLAADCVFRLRPYDRSKRSRSSTVALDVRRRSLYLMQGPARSQWEHSTNPVAQVRYSITLRTRKRNRADG